MPLHSVEVTWVTGHTVTPLGVNNRGYAACLRTDYYASSSTNFITNYPHQYDSPPDYSHNTVEFHTNYPSTNSYILSSAGSSSGTSIPFTPVAMSNTNTFIGENVDGASPYFDANITGTSTLPSGFYAGSLNAAQYGVGTNAY
jgi:hypothetical protein